MLFFNFLNIYKTFLRIHHLSITKITRKDWKKKSCEKYRSLSKEGENKKQQNRREQYKNLSEDEKKMFVEYKKNY